MATYWTAQNSDDIESYGAGWVEESPGLDFGALEHLEFR